VFKKEWKNSIRLDLQKHEKRHRIEFTKAKKNGIGLDLQKHGKAA